MWHLTPFCFDNISLSANIAGTEHNNESLAYIGYDLITVANRESDSPKGARDIFPKLSIYSVPLYRLLTSIYISYAPLSVLFTSRKMTILAGVIIVASIILVHSGHEFLLY